MMWATPVVRGLEEEKDLHHGIQESWLSVEDCGKYILEANGGSV